MAAPKVAGAAAGPGRGAPESASCDEELAAARCWACCRHGDLYPDGLRDAADAPWALIGRGDPGLLDGLEPFGAVTIVGARRATSYGREVARELGRELAAAGMVVVSGLAFGIDACAHRGAARRRAARSPSSAAAPTPPTRRRTARSGGGSAKRAW